MPDDKNHNFAGIIRYEMEIESDDKIIALDLGEVREGAEVWINGKNAGTRIGYPYYFDVSSLSVCGCNRIQIDVTTTLAFAQCDGFSEEYDPLSGRVMRTDKIYDAKMVNSIC